MIEILFFMMSSLVFLGYTQSGYGHPWVSLGFEPASLEFYSGPSLHKRIEKHVYCSVGPLNVEPFKFPIDIQKVQPKPLIGVSFMWVARQAGRFVTGVLEPFLTGRSKKRASFKGRNLNFKEKESLNLT